jgi:NIMA (never in mitosis gene a)-related kinase
MFKAVMQRNMGGRTLVELAQARYAKPLDETKRNGESRIPTVGLSSQQISTVLKIVDRDPPATWDPEKDEMPSPFLARNTKLIRNLR